MRRPLLAALLAFLPAACNLVAQDAILNPLPAPLRLPPGLVETLPLNNTGSFFGEAIRAVDCNQDQDFPYGTCGNILFGGLVMGDSHLSGSIRIQFDPPVANVAHFEVTHGVLHGDDAVLEAPQGYELPLLSAQVSDAPGLVCDGDLDLTTGGVINLQYSVLFSDTAIDALDDVNPKLGPLTIQFPGQRGHAWARFEQRPDGLLDYTFRGSTFLPLGEDIDGDPVRFPMPFCNTQNCASIWARGTSFHPHLYLSTKEPDGDPCGLNCPDIPVNTIQEFTVFTADSSFGDDFNLDIPELGGSAEGRSQLLGRLQIQFGPRSGDTVPFVVNSLVPESLMAQPPPNSLLGNGFQPGLLGQDEFLRFPLQTYFLQQVALFDEPFNIIHGAVDLKTGRMIGEMEYPSYFAQNLALLLFQQNAGQISTDPFYLLALHPNPGEDDQTYALFEKGVNGQTVFRFSGEHRRSFAGFRFPTPALDVNQSYLGGPNATLDLFLRIQAMHTADAAPVRETGAVSGVVSSIGDTFSYSYSIPCNPAGESFSFTYTNNNAGPSGGTFQMKRLGAVQCLNSRTSSLPQGDYDTITFSGFGEWSTDTLDSSPRFASVQISTAPDSPYVGILVFQSPDASGNVVLSSANTRPAQKPLP